MEVTIDTVEKLILSLYHNSDVNVQAQANQYLTVAQVSPQAWQFVSQLLASDKPVEVQYFGASTLYLKMARFWHELDSAEKQIGMKNELVETLIRHMSLKGAKIVETRLIMALSVCVIQSIGNVWENAIEELIGIFNPSKLAHIPEDKLAQTLLEIMTCIPEEFQAMHMIIHQKVLMRSALLKYANNAFSMILSVMSSQQHNQLKPYAIKCFSNWSEKFGPLLLNESHDQIILLIMECVCNDDLSNISVDAITTIYSHPEMHKNPNSVLKLIDIMVGLENVLVKAIQESNEDICSCIYNLFIQVAETHSRLLLDSLIDKPQHRDNILKVISVILQCSSSSGHYPVDETFSEQSFNFWYTLQDDIISSDESKIQSYITLFNPLFHSLINAYIVKAQFPRDESYETEWNSDEKEQFRCYRQDIGDSFMYCYNILRVSMMSNLLSHLNLAGNQLAEKINSDVGNCWQYLEAVIYSFGSIAENVDADEFHYLPQLFDFLPNIPFSGVKTSRLLSTTMDTLAAYSEWISVHPNYLPNVISILVLGIKCGHHQVTISATMALKDIARECQFVIKPYAEHLLSVCEEMLREDSPLKVKERARLMCTAGLVLSVMPLEVIMTSINGLLNPVLTQLQNLVNQSDQNNLISNRILKEQVSSQLNMLAMLFSTLDVNLKRIDLEEGEEVNLKSALKSNQVIIQQPQPLYIVLQQVLPLLGNVAYKFSCDEVITESLCDCIKKCVVTLLCDIKPMVNDILQLLIHVYFAMPHASILDISKQLIVLFGKDDDMENALKVYFAQLSDHTLSLCQENMHHQTCLIETFYTSWSYVLKKVPTFYQYNLLDVSSLFRCAMTALILPEKTTVRACSVFISEFINYSREVESMVKVVNTETESLVGQVFLVIGGTYNSPRSVVEHMADILMAINQKYSDNLCRCMNLYVAKDAFPTPQTSREQKEHFVRMILKERKNKRKLKEIINEFCLTCRGIINTEYGNQAIKLPF